MRNGIILIGIAIFAAGILSGLAVFKLMEINRPPVYALPPSPPPFTPGPSQIPSLLTSHSPVTPLPSPAIPQSSPLPSLTPLLPSIATLSPTPTPLTLQPFLAPPDSSVPQKLIFEDDFSDPSSGWARYSDASSESSYENREYSLLLKQPRSWAWRYIKFIGEYTDVSFEVDVRDLASNSENGAGL